MGTKANSDLGFEAVSCSALLIIAVVVGRLKGAVATAAVAEVCPTLRGSSHVSKLLI